MLFKFLERRYKFKRIWVFLVVAWLCVLPASAIAGEAATQTLQSLGLQAPFLMSWITVWFFAIGGGVLSNFVKLDIDADLRWVYVAKPLMGILLAIAFIMYLNGEAEPPDPSFALAALGTAFVGAPLMQGALVYITKNNFLPALFDNIAKKFTGVK